MKVITTRTAEIDDREKALAEIMQQLSADTLCANTIGIMYCHYEFIHSGVAGYICENLPFEVVGASTTLAGFNKSKDDTNSYARGAFRLIISVLTADDVTFTTALTPPLSKNADLDEICRETFAGKGSCKFAMAFLPYIGLFDGDGFVDKVVEHLNVPLFGGFAVDDSATYDNDCYVFYGKKCLKEQGAFLLFDGNIDPHFRSAVVFEDKWFSEHIAVITKAEGNKIISVNNRPVTEFLDIMGLKLTHLWSDMIIGSVLMIDDGDGEAYGRSMLFLDDNDHLILGGAVTEGALVAVATFEKYGVLTASRSVTKEIIDEYPDATFVFVSSCETRHIMLGVDSYDGEIMLRQELGDLPFSLAYAGGEICPVKKSTNENPKSRLMNQSFCLCVI
jgi:hypothetical protein